VRETAGPGAFRFPDDPHHLLTPASLGAFALSDDSIRLKISLQVLAVGAMTDLLNSNPGGGGLAPIAVVEGW
jgi:hypothetical protein